MDCRQGKHAASRLGIASAARVLAESLSCSALRTHCAVWRFMQERDFRPAALVQGQTTSFSPLPLYSGGEGLGVRG